MSGKLIGYVRVSTVEQNTSRQLEGIDLNKCFEDKASGKDTNRPALSALKEFVREGDTVIVHSMDRLARNLDDLRKIVKELTGKGVTVKFQKEGLTFTGDDTPRANLLLSVMGAFAEFERALIKERQAEGIALAKVKGVYKGRKPSVDAAMVAEMKRRIDTGEPKAQIARDLNISRETLYQHIRS